MSAQTKPTPRLTIPRIRERKGGTPLAALTCYTAPMAKLLDGIADILLVGDSLGMVIYGMDSTLNLSLDTMILHAHAVAKHAKQSCVVADLPFGSYQESPEQAFRSAARLIAESGAQGVKLEGGAEMEDTIRFLTRRGIPVMGHVGLKPQYVNAMGGFKVQGRVESERAAILEDAKAVERAGAFSLVIEGTEESLAREMTESIGIPTIGIGASSACDGQVLVIDDVLGMLDYAPSFVKKYAELAPIIQKAAKAYAEDVRARKFPGEGQVFRKK
jgi:3-methyl-2-oxobutanoate hydroxymethyltransferase